MLAFILGGCETTNMRMQRLAEDNDLVRYQAIGDTYRHLIFERPRQGEPLFVFIEGDGTPWINGNIIADDPTPRTTIAFDLMLASDVPAIYVGRPCYFGLNDPPCTGADWTHGRFSERVVASMAAAIIHNVDDEERRIVLVGYSGGGALALLLAPRLANVDAVVTIAGLVDTDAWAAHHGYEPLSGSINPATIRIPRHIRQIHLVGENDSIVPPTQTAEAISTWKNRDLWRYPEFDHRCCWREQWQEIYQRISAEL